MLSFTEHARKYVALKYHWILVAIFVFEEFISFLIYNDRWKSGTLRREAYLHINNSNRLIVKRFLYEKVAQT